MAGGVDNGRQVAFGGDALGFPPASFGNGLVQQVLYRGQIAKVTVDQLDAVAQVIREVTADESRDAGDENPHAYACRRSKSMTFRSVVSRSTAGVKSRVRLSLLMSGTRWRGSSNPAS